MIRKSEWLRNGVDHDIASGMLKNKRLTTRLGKWLRQGSEHSTNEGLPAACPGWADTQAVYRFLDNPPVEFHDILAGRRSWVDQSAIL